MTEDDGDLGDRWRDLAGTGPTIGRTFLERLLLSLIDAHPNPTVPRLSDHILHDRERRLRVAMAALCNEQTSEELPDHAALLWMAQQNVRDRQMRYVRAEEEKRSQGIEKSLAGRTMTSLRSTRQLAQEASLRFYPDVSDRSERLRKKWAQQKEFWLEMARSHDYVRETLEMQSLAKVRIALEEAHLRIVPNWPDGHAMSEDQMLRTEMPELRQLVELRRKTDVETTS